MRLHVTNLPSRYVRVLLQLLHLKSALRREINLGRRDSRVSRRDTYFLSFLAAKDTGMISATFRSYCDFTIFPQFFHCDTSLFLYNQTVWYECKQKYISYILPACDINECTNTIVGYTALAEELIIIVRTRASKMIRDTNENTRLLKWAGGDYYSPFALPQHCRMNAWEKSAVFKSPGRWYIICGW